MVVTLRTLRFCAILTTAIGLVVMMPRDVAAKPCECKDIAAMTAELARVSTAEAVWKEIFAWARGLHPDLPEPSSNDELNTKYAQLARAPRADWDRIMHAPIQQIEKLNKAGSLDGDGEPIVNADFAQAHCDDIVEGVRVHERAHRSFFLSPGNSIEGGLMRSRHLRLRSESEVVSYRTQKEFLKEKLDALKKRCKGYRATGQTADTTYSGVICSLEKPFTVNANNPVIAYPFEFIPSSATNGTVSFKATIPMLHAFGSGTYTIEGADTKTPRIIMTAGSTGITPKFSLSGGGTVQIDLVPLDTDECSRPPG